jgi:hypothetical protein
MELFPEQGTHKKAPMQPEAISAVRWAVAPSSAKGATDVQLTPAPGLLAGGAHLTLSVPPLLDPSVQASLSVRSLGESFAHGMRNSFTKQPMADLLAASKTSDTAAVSVALVRVIDATNSASMLMKMGSQINSGIKTLTSQSG